MSGFATAVTVQMGGRSHWRTGLDFFKWPYTLAVSAPDVQTIFRANFIAESFAFVCLAQSNADLSRLHLSSVWWQASKQASVHGLEILNTDYKGGYYGRITLG